MARLYEVIFFNESFIKQNKDSKLFLLYLCVNDTIIPTIVKYLYKIGAVIFFLIVEVSANAQCAMCKATAESNPDVGGGLNAGIEYILVFPYLLLGFFAILVFRGRLLIFWQDLIGKGKEDKTKTYSAKDWY